MDKFIDPTNSPPPLVYFRGTELFGNKPGGMDSTSPDLHSQTELVQFALHVLNHLGLENLTFLESANHESEFKYLENGLASLTFLP